MLTMHDRFTVRAPIQAVWQFLMDPWRVASCVPGAHLDEVESDRAFRGSIQIAIGPFKTTYSGRVEFTKVDEGAKHVHMTAEGHERGSGAARGRMFSSLLEIGDATEVFVDVSVEGTSRLMDNGLNLGQNIAHELFAQFVARLKEQLEPDASPAASVKAQRSVQVMPLLAKALARRFSRQRQPER